MKKLDNTFKYPYAYDIFQNMILLNDAKKLQDTRYWLDPGLQIELKLYRQKKRNQTHWRSLPDQKITINGIDYEYSIDKDSESYEHKQFKYNIIQNKYIDICEYRVFLINPREEIRILHSKFRADVLAELECGTLCVIEIIKTSDLSEKKHNFLEHNKVLTFKIYIDENGNQIFTRDEILGEPEITETKRRIQKGEGELEKILEYVRNEKRSGHKKYDQEMEKIGSTCNTVSRRIYEIRMLTESVDEQIRIYEQSIRQKYEQDIRDLERKYKEMQQTIQSSPLYNQLGKRYQTLLNEQNKQN